MAEDADEHAAIAKKLIDVAHESLNHDPNPDDLLKIAALIADGRRIGAIPPGPPSQVLALAFVGVIEGVRIHLAGQTPSDVLLAERAAFGVLGLAPASGATDTT
jgi:hypothetical protein